MKRYIILILIICRLGFSGDGFSRELLPVEDLKFTNFSSDTLFFDKDSSLLNVFFARYDSVLTSQTGNINVLHIGGSHVQAGVMSQQIRKHMLSDFFPPYARRGMIFPYRVAKTNNPIDYKVTYKGEWKAVRNVQNPIFRPLGLTGICVYTNDTLAKIAVKLKDSLSFVSQKICLLGFSDSSLVVPSIVIDSIDYQPTEIDTVLRRYTYDIPSVSSEFSVKINCRDSSQLFTLTGLFLDNDYPGLSFHSIGVNGASVPSYLNCEYFEEDLELVHPDLVIFGIGINDAASVRFNACDFQSSYQQLIDKIKNVNPDCAFIFITNNDSYRKVRGKFVVNKNALIAQETFYALAEANKGAVWDQFDIMGGLKSMYQWKSARLAKPDRVHFTDAGYELIGDLFYNAFISAYLNYKESLKPETK